MHVQGKESSKGACVSLDQSPVVFIVDDDPKALRILTNLLEGNGWAIRTYQSAADFLGAYQTTHCGCLLLDIRMPDLAGPELQKELLARQIDLPVIFLSANADVPTAVQLIKQGAVDIIEKPFDPDRLTTLVRETLAKRLTTVLERSQRDAIMARRAQLTPRECEIMDLIVAGMANKQIAFRLRISERTVEIHRARVMKKMNAKSIAELVRTSMQSQ